MPKPHRLPKPRNRRTRSALALYAQALRAARGLSQEELADAAGVNVSTVKNAEGDRPIRLDTLAAVYRDGIPRQPLTDPEWLQLVVYWANEHTGGDGGRSLLVEDLRESLGATKVLVQKTLDSHVKALMALPEQTRSMLEQIAKICGKRDAKKFITALVGLVELYES